MLIPTTLPRRIKEARRAAGLSQKEFSALAKVGQTTLLRIENGHTRRMVERTLVAIQKTIKDLRDKPGKTRARALRQAAPGVAFKPTPELVMRMLCKGRIAIDWPELQYISELAGNSDVQGEDELELELHCRRIRLALRPNGEVNSARAAIEAISSIVSAMILQKKLEAGPQEEP